MTSRPALNELHTTEEHARLAAALNHVLAGRFDVLQPIAIGGMAVIFQLRHKYTDGLFAAKIMHPALSRRPGFALAFEREARIGARLGGHPNAVAILDLAGADGLPYLLMPYIEGEDLDLLLARHGRLPREECLMLLAQLTSLLMFAEKEGILHADVSLGNIRLDRFGQYRLFDYGLARSFGPQPKDLPVQGGTPAFNSPEQLRGEPLDIRSDLYSLGLVFFHALTGHAAFDLTDLDQLANAHLNGRWTMPEALAEDPPVAALLQKLIAPDREQRLASAFELAGALTALGYELPSFHRTLPSVTPDLPRPRRRRLQAT